jgi:hypothetical protein
VNQKNSALQQPLHGPAFPDRAAALDVCKLWSGCAKCAKESLCERVSKRIADVSVRVCAWLQVCAAAIATGSWGGLGRSPPPTTLRNLSESPSGSAY